MKKYLRTFTGCRVGEEQLKLLYLNNVENTMMSLLVNKGYLQITKQDGKYRTFALTEKGKNEVSKREVKLSFI